MQRLAATRGNPSAFSELVFGTPLHAGQQRYAANATADVNFLLPGNSWGKTEFIARYITYVAWFKISRHTPTSWEEWLSQEYKALVGSYNYPIAKESFDRLLNHHKNREEFRALVSSISRTDPPRVVLSNGAIIDWGSLDQSGKLVEAARRRRIMVDEVGHIPDLSYTFDSILFPRTMGVGGIIDLLGTPKPHSDPYLLEVYEKGRYGTDPFYYSQDGSVLENEFWPLEERQRVFRNPRYVKGWQPCPAPGACADALCLPAGHPILTQMGEQVILGRFVLAGGYFFNRFHVQRMFTGDFPEDAWFGDDFFAEEPQPGRMYMGAWDLGGNRKRKRRKHGSDATVGFVLDYTERPWRVVYYNYIEGGEADWQDKYEAMETCFRRYPMPYMLIDSTGTVDTVQEALYERGVEVEGIHFGGSSGRKFDMLRAVQLALEMEWGGQRGLLRCPLIPGLKHELDHYVIPDDDIEQDRVMALAMAVQHAMQWEVPDAIGGDVW